MTVVIMWAGLRQFHESGPELKRTISGHLNEILDAVEPSTRRCTQNILASE